MSSFKFQKMEKIKALEKKKLMSELTQGKEFVNQLKKQLGSPEECDLLLGKILSSLEKSLSILNLKALLLQGRINANSTSSSSSISFLGNSNNSPKSEILGSSGDQLGQNMVSKKRKKSQQWTNQVSISGTGLNGTHKDGYSWRKYGQKEILGTNHPRAYYRCTHRNTQGCLATKQVQRSDGNSSIIEFTYKGRHSCKVAQSNNKKQEQAMVLFNSGPNEQVFTPFSFPLNIEETKFFSDSMAPFSSPITSEFAIDHILQTAESDLTELISTPFRGDSVVDDFEPSVTFDIEEFFN